MKFDRFDFERYFRSFFILPTIQIIINEQCLLQDNFSIQIHWLNLHCRWRWIK